MKMYSLAVIFGVNGFLMSMSGAGITTATYWICLVSMVLVQIVSQLDFDR